jgi:hypothetical protein
MNQSLSTEEEFRTVISNCRTLFLKKMHDYGTAWSIMRPTSITDQIYIKASRIRSLETGEAMVDEGVVPEFIAIVNYAIMGLIILSRPALKGDLEESTLSDDEALRLYDECAETSLQLMLRKNHDYDEAWRGMRVSSYTDFILMKLLRTKQIERLDGQTLVSEGVAENYKDMMNYAVFGLIKLTLEEQQ